MKLIEWLDELSYDEAWIGEHHSAGWETIASPEIIIGAVVIAAVVLDNFNTWLAKRRLTAKAG